jgi:hypothetical protein
MEESARDLGFKRSLFPINVGPQQNEDTTMPSRRKDNSSPKAIARKIKERRGRLGIDYLPWFFTTDVASWGTSSIMTGWNGQEHHWLSLGERKTAFCYAWRPDRVIEMLGQYPILPREETVAIAQMMGVRHPPGVITIDFMLKILRPNGETYYVARDVKEMKELVKPSVQEELSIALIAMEVRGIDWGLVVSDSENFPETEWQNVDWTFKKHDIKKAIALLPDRVWEIANRLNSQIAASQAPTILRNVCLDSDRAFGLPRGTSMSIARFLVANKAWEVDMSQIICTSSPMKINTDSFQATMGHLCGRRELA